MSTETSPTNPPQPLAARCREGYDRWAASYDRIDNPLVAQASAAIAARASWFTGARVLELGCGTGRNAAAALSAGALSFLGVDASRGMLEVARERIDDPRASFVEGDVTDPRSLPQDRPFDLVLVCLVLEHLPQVAPLLQVAALSLRPSGRLMVLELHPGLHDSGKRAHFRDGDEEIELPSFRHDEAELLAEAARAGFARVEIADRAPDEAALARSQKLARYLGRPVLLELVAER